MVHAGKQVKRDALQPGDLIVFSGTTRSRAAGAPSHCGIYLGAGRFIQMGVHGIKVLNLLHYLAGAPAFLTARRLW